MKFLMPTCAAVLLATTATTTTAAPAEHRQLQVLGITAVARQLLTAVNDARSKNGKQPLCLNAKLATASQVQAVDMAAGGFISATGSSGSLPTARATDLKFNTTGVAEVVGAGYADASVAIKEWMSSPGYSTYILGDYKFMGAGYAYNSAQVYKSFWVLDFANDAVGETCA